ncbi:SUMO-specific isopeptidase USPL1 isoform X2 [Dunckerocampus dactyliophorus]|uniref:SUMO-specific isopeptidase USPL1 isoform X2 n=1 Tax=Dunckerocampus dactyliophorus TaxID=161453 RepID=UPI00240548FB|nr:SUMO-specific isopeptidase USPL1 isoform X2 [Dunckerocampus dactyliophorus]
MVILLEWQRADLGRSGGIPMTGDSEDAGLGALASPLAGYLGKVQERAASLDSCPWCASKGLRSTLHSYRINLHESITLCTNPQCLFPLVSRPLEDVLASLVPAQSAAESRRKKASTLEEEEEEEVEAKCLLSNDLPGSDPPRVTDVNNAKSGTPNVIANGHREAAMTHYEQENQPCIEFPPGSKSSRHEDGVPNQTSFCDAHSESSDSSAAMSGLLKGPSEEEPLSPRPDMMLAKEMNTPNMDIHTLHTPQNSLAAETDQDAMSGAGGDAVDLVSSPEHLFWRNSHNLCWLDVLLVVLVHSHSLRRCKAQQEPQQAAIWQLMSGYDDACAALRACQQIGSNGSTRVPRDALQHANDHLQSLRTSIFALLQPLLRCKLGQRESPVFAMPLLLARDSWAERLFQTTFYWEFECAECHTVTREKITKTLATFTNILPDWHPLHATHLAPCNVCRAKNQRRSMTLESVAPVLALHFVEGLPHSDVAMLAFTFKGRRHAVTAVVQYDQRAKHFVSWTCRSDGSWLEFDDLKHPHSVVHPELPVPAQEIHIVFWEAEEDSGPRVCSPSSTLSQPPPTRSMLDCSANGEASDQLDFVSALADDSITAMDTTIAAAGMDTFEGLSSDDIITLTLMEIKEESETDPPVMDLSDFPDAMPDSSSLLPVAAPESVARESPPSPSSAESNDDLTKDPNFEPACKTAPRRSKRIIKQQAKKSSRTKAPPPASLPSQEADTTRQEDAQSEQTTSPVSSTDTTLPPLRQEAHWSYLLSKYHVGQTNKLRPTRAPNTVSQVKPAPPNPSSPIPIKKPQVPAPVFQKPQLRMEDRGGLPLKAAERFGAFGVQSQAPTVSPALPCSSSVAALAMKTLPDVSLLKKHGSPSKLLAGLSDTEALRYKLLKKLKAKKKKLAKINQLLGQQGGAQLHPDSTHLGSPVTVTSSTYDSSNCNSILSDLLSPAPTPSDLSPDSSGFLDMLTSRQDGAGTASSQILEVAPNAENFLEEFMTTSGAEQAMETEALSALELFF